MSDPYLPMGTTDSDPYFDLPNVRGWKKYKPPLPPKIVMVWCVEGQHHWEAVATDGWGQAQTRTCLAHDEADLPDEGE